MLGTSTKAIRPANRIVIARLAASSTLRQTRWPKPRLHRSERQPEQAATHENGGEGQRRNAEEPRNVRVSVGGKIVRVNLARGKAATIPLMLICTRAGNQKVAN